MPKSPVKIRLFHIFEAVHQKLVYHRFRAISAFWHQNHNSQNPLLAILSQRWLRFLCFAQKMYIGEKSVFSTFRGHFFRLKSYFYLRSYFAFNFRFTSDKESVRTGTKWCLWPQEKLETARSLYRRHGLADVINWATYACEDWNSKAMKLCFRWQ